MAFCKYVKRKPGHNYWVYQRRVPTPLVEMIGKTTWYQSLKTEDREVAHRRGLMIDADVEAEIARAYRILEGKPLAGDEISKIGETHFERTNAYLDGLSSRIAGDDTAILRRAMPPSPGPTNLDDFIAWANSDEADSLYVPDPAALQRGARDRLAVLLVHQKHGDFSPVQTFADHEFERLGLAGSRVDNDGRETLEIDRTRPDYTALARELMEKEIASVKRQLVQIAKAEVGHIDPPQIIMAPPVTAAAAPTELHPDAKKTPMELFDKFATYCRDSDLSQSTINNYRTAIMRLEEVTKKKAIAFVTQNDVIDCVDLISKAPAKYKTMLDAQTMSESIVENQERIEKGEAAVKITTPATVRKHISAMKTFFGWAKQRNLIAANPAAEVKGPKKGKVLEERGSEDKKGYSIDEIRAIFEMNEFISPNKELPYRFWVPLCALFTGARMGEICSLAVDDIREERGYSWFMITATKTKTRYAVPVHDELKRIGFLEYVARRRKAGGKKLFPDAPLGAAGRNAYAPVTQWWDHVTTRDGIKRPGRNIHRFRHSFTTAARASEVSYDIAQALIGHTSGSTDVHQNYGDLPEVIDLWEKGISKLVYRGVDLSHLYPKR